MKNLYLIFKKDTNQTTLDLLKKSAEERNISVIPIYSEDFDFSENLILTKEDALYRLSIDKRSELVEKFLINENVTTFYHSINACVSKLDNVIEATLIHKKNNLPIIKTIFSLTNNKELLKMYAKELNNFPLIIKSVGGQHGVGVMKIDSLESLFSISDYLHKQNDSYILRQFIDYTEHARLIVLGNSVISSIEYKRVTDDFRSNVGKELTLINKKFDPTIEDIAVKAVSSLGFDFGGVDILIDKSGLPFIAEVNFPCFFPRAQQYSNIDISGKMIDFLLNKSKVLISP
ncbi:MAG: hypothetical protein RBS56_00230 [Candidatus Gracilibacteria bacterium]|jgi:glutathione synthase/RimK-type ligase-like ATP-grasp enzyme|nr:hypothetical protein [Candidatus Gracilibacteria bacterium]